MTRDVRPATTDDVWAIHETARESWHAAYDDLLGPGRVDAIVDEWYGIGDLESSIDDANGRDDVAFLVAEPHSNRSELPDERESEFADDCHGFAHAVPWPENAAVAYLARLYVRPSVWREGTGTALLDRLETVLDDSFSRLRSAVLVDNEIGVSFVETNGFDPVDSRTTDLGERLEERVYEKELSGFDE